jgi:HYR domain
LTVSNCTVSGNSASNGGLGGGILNYSQTSGSATLTIVNSTVSGNSAGLGGGGIYNDGEAGSAGLTVINSTFSGNSATNGGGGGIINQGPGGSASLTVINSTFSGNSAAIGNGGGIYNSGFNGSATLQIGSTILNVGPAGGNIVNDFGTVTSDGYNLSSDDGGGFLTATGDQTYTPPLIGPLQDNGGPTQTHALLCGSPAIDAGTNFSGSATDQRGVGFARTFNDPAVANVGDGTDIGGFEAQTPLSCNQPPVAICTNVTVAAGANCLVTASIDKGSYDPDSGDTITRVQSPPSPYSLGNTLVTLTVTDNHGASNNCSATVTIVDTTPPVPTVASLAAVSNQCSATLTAPHARNNCAGLITATTSDPTTYSSQGSFTVHWIYNDGNGNSVTQLQAVVIKDTLPPSISCPPNVTTNTVSPGGVNVTFAAPVVSDNCGGVIVTSSRASGSLFAIGTTVVTNRVIDGGGHTNLCTLTVRVKGAKDQINDLIGLVSGLPIQSGTKIGLVIELIEAQVDLDKGRTSNTCGELKDFIALISAQKGKKLTVAQATFLTGEATRIRAVLACP